MVVCCAIIEQDGKVLLAQRGLKQKLAGKWEFPGGKMEPGESTEACLKREILEELDITIITGKRLPDFPIGDIGKLIPFYCQIIEGTIKLLEHQAVVWVEPTQLLNYDLSPADVPVAKHVIASMA